MPMTETGLVLLEAFESLSSNVARDLFSQLDHIVEMTVTDASAAAARARPMSFDLLTRDEV